MAVQSNNEAEYATLETGLQFCLEYGIKRLQIKGDALLVVIGVWQSKNPNLRKFCLKVQSLLKKFEAWSLKHIDRNLNEEAHNAAQEMIIQLYVIRTDGTMYVGRESLSSIENFLLTGSLPEGLETAKKYAFLRKASKYTLLNDVLFMKGQI